MFRGNATVSTVYAALTHCNSFAVAGSGSRGHIPGVGLVHLGINFFVGFLPHPIRSQKKNSSEQRISASCTSLLLKRLDTFRLCSNQQTVRVPETPKDRTPNFEKRPLFHLSPRAPRGVDENVFSSDLLMTWWEIWNTIDRLKSRP